MKKKYGANIQLLFTDTDSLMYEVCTDDFYQDMWAMRDQFDLATYPKKSPFYDRSNNKVVGKFKDEANGDPIIEFVGLKPKMYSYQTLSLALQGDAAITTKKRAKGIQRTAVAKLRHEEYKAQLDHPEDNFVPNRRFGSRVHQIYGIEVRLTSQTHAPYSLLFPQIPFLASLCSSQLHHFIPSQCVCVDEETWTGLIR